MTGDFFEGDPAPNPGMPREPIVRSAEIEGNYRWVLRRAWGAGPAILWCGLNPSTADGQRDDPTMLREIGFSYRWGFGSLVKVNIYPFITSDPGLMLRWRESVQQGNTDHGCVWPYDETPLAAWLHNMKRVHEEIIKADRFVAAWGNGALPDDLTEFMQGVSHKFDGKQDFIEMPIQWECVGVNKNGSPKHTLARGKGRVPDTATLMPWGC